VSRTEALQKLSEDLRERLGVLRGVSDDHRREIRDADNGNTDSLDQASQTASIEVTARLATHESQEANQIVLALDAIENGTYGVCEGCQTPIPIERLEVLPYSTLCITCKVIAEKEGVILPEGESRQFRSSDEDD